MRRSDPYHKPQTKTKEAEVWSAEGKLNLFGPSSPGPETAEGNTHGAQGSAALLPGEQESVWRGALQEPAVAPACGPGETAVSSPAGTP